jgi:hypothetical protein
MAVRQKDVSREALSRLPKLDIRELREEWRRLYKTDASPHLSRELLIRAVAYRMQEVALGGLRPEPQRQLRQIAEVAEPQNRKLEAVNAPNRDPIQTALCRGCCSEYRNGGGT